MKENQQSVTFLCVIYFAYYINYAYSETNIRICCCFSLMRCQPNVVNISNAGREIALNKQLCYVCLLSASALGCGLACCRLESEWNGPRPRHTCCRWQLLNRWKDAQYRSV